MKTKDVFRVLAAGAAIALALPGSGRAGFTPQPIVHSCSADGLAQFECGNNQAIPDCSVTCFGRASCTDARCDTIYVEGPLGHTDEIVTQFYVGPMCACVGGWNRLDSIQHVSCLSELFRRTDVHRSKTAKALTKCEVGVLMGRVTLPAGGSCVDSDERTAASIASSRRQAEQAIMRKCPAEVLEAVYGTEGAESMTTFVGGLLSRAEEDAASGITLALRTAVVKP